MAVPHASTNFGDLLDKRITSLFNNQYDSLPDMIADFYAMKTSGFSEERWSEIGAMPDIVPFTGTVQYGSQNQGYDTIFTHVEFAGGLQIERALFDDDRFNTMNQKPVALADAFYQRRMKDGARTWNNAFAVDPFFKHNTEAVALCSNSHTTTSGASTASGFDNLVTTALTTTALISARIQFRGFRGDQAERRSFMPDELLVPIDLEDKAWEIIKSAGKPDTANNNANFNKDRYPVRSWEYISDTNDWWIMDSRSRKKFLVWYDRIPLEFGSAEEFDTFVAKWRGYTRYSHGHTNWRFILGAQVS